MYYFLQALSISVSAAFVCVVKSSGFISCCQYSKQEFGWCHCSAALNFGWTFSKTSLTVICPCCIGFLFDIWSLSTFDANIFSNNRDTSKCKSLCTKDAVHI